MSTETIEQIGKSIVDMREVLDTVTTDQKSLKDKLELLPGEEKAKFEKIEAAMHLADEKAQEAFISKTQAENEKKQMEERLVNLEGQIIKQSTMNEGVDYKESNEYKAFNSLVKSASYSKNEISADELKYLRTDSGQQGGYLVPEVLATEMLKKVVEISDVRRLSRVRNMPGVKTLDIPIRNTIPTATYEGEAEDTNPSNSTYGNLAMTAHRLSITTETTWDLLKFAGFDMESEITQDAITAFAFGEGNKFVLGTGVKQPKGILSDGTGITQIDSATSGVVSLKDVIQLEGQLKTGYNPIYAFNRATKVALRVETDQNGQFLWQVNGTNQPSLINDHPFVILQDMADIASNSLSVLFGDFFRGYNILDSVDLLLIRDQVTQGGRAKVLFHWHKWNDGQVVLAEAFKILKTKT